MTPEITAISLLCGDCIFEASNVAAVVAAAANLRLLD